MQPTIPQAVAAGEQLAKHSTLIDAEFALLERPATYREGASPGELIAAASKSNPDYRREIDRITAKALAPIVAVEVMYRQIDEYAGQVFRACKYMLGECDDLGEIVDSDLAAQASMIRRAFKSSVLTRKEVENICQRSQDEVAEGLRRLEKSSAFVKRQKRATKRTLLSKSVETLNAVLATPNTTLSPLEKDRLKRLAKRTASRSDSFGRAYKELYFAKRGYKKDGLPPYKFGAWRWL